MTTTPKRLTRTTYHDGQFSDEEIEYMGRTGQIPLSLVPTNECAKCGCTVCHCEAEREEYERVMAENAPNDWLDDNPPAHTDRDVPALTPEEEDEEHARLSMLDEIERDRWDDGEDTDFMAGHCWSFGL